MRDRIMSSATDDILADLLAASDDRLAAVILAATGVPATRADLRLWRSALRRLLHRRRRVRECEPEPMAPVVVARDEARELVLDMLLSPEMLLLLTSAAAIGWLIGALPIAAIAAARARYALLAAAHGMEPDTLDCAHAYAVAKAAPGGATAADFWLAARVDPAVRAALNAATSERLGWWISRFEPARGVARPTAGVLRGLSAEGAEVMAAYRDLDLSAVAYGPSLGIWPPPQSVRSDSGPDGPQPP
jgi:hypothetical protein